MTDKINHQQDDPVSFREIFSPEYALVVTVFEPDGPGTATRTFKAGQDDDLRRFVDEYNGRWNCYYHVNPVWKVLRKKASKTDIHSMCWVHCDLDPRPDFPLDDERQRIRSVILAFKTPPTIVVDSGNGFQCLWKLKHPARVDKSIAQANKLAGYNRWVSQQMGGDIGTVDVSRVLRLPGTINVPTPTKIKKGRVPSVARLVEHHPDRVYVLNDFGWDRATSGTDKAVESLGAIKEVPIPDEFFTIMTMYDSLRDRWNGSVLGLKDRSRSGRDFSLIAILKNEGFTVEQTFAIARAFPYGKVAESSFRYFERMWSRANTPEEWMLQKGGEG